ncbi:MAG: PBP1A family penicillin-binding protein [Proteobacteria bacterium]|nr:PBP1A family penicillin-binding protein [Pseudomonadota bacterium]
MANRGGRRRKSSGRSSKKRWGRPRWWTRRAFRATGLGLAGAAFVAGFATAVYVVKLDRVVVRRFAGVQFQVPSKVLSAPTILYPGLDAKRAGLRSTLERLGYREDPDHFQPPLGRFRWEGDRIRIHLRAFEHPTRAEPARLVELRLAGSVIERIRELPGRGEVGAVPLEPELVGAYYGDAREQRELVRLDEVPRHLVDAVYAVEDQRFEQHVGIDLRRILGAGLANLRAGRVAQGGSTLTQQLVKNFFLTPERTLKRKLQEAIMALIVEVRYDKQAILESYLNEIYLGQRGATEVHGVGEAAHFYFGKRVADLSVAESALIAAIIQSPNSLSPHRNQERAVRRRNLVLELMHRQQRIGDFVYERARNEPLRVAAITVEPSQARYFLDVLRRQLPEVYDQGALATEGLRIYSTLDPRLQRVAAEALRGGLEALEKQRPELVDPDPMRLLQGCVVALRPQTGEIVALVGGRDYGVSQFDRCTQARRQAGSIFKPFVYIAALEPRGGTPWITLASTVDDSPFEIETSAGPWRPENYDEEFRGLVPVREALERSLNVPVARLAHQIGIDAVAQVARRLGISSPLPRVPSLALGAADVTPLEIARAYATLANAGIRPWPHAFEDVVAPQGGTLERRDLRFERVMDAGTAYLATSLLEGVVDRGTAARLRGLGFRGPIAGKTGTSDDERDLWFVGFTPELVTVVWVGFDEPRSVGVPSSRAALPVWARFMREATGPSIRGAFLPPGDVVKLDIEPQTGARASVGCPDRRPEYFLPGTEPQDVCTGLRGWRVGRESDAEGPGRRRGFLDWLRERF